MGSILHKISTTIDDFEVEGCVLLRTKIAEHYEFEVFLEFLLLALCFFIKFLVFSLFLPNDTNTLNDSNEEKSLH